jgi:hypothetical protein
MSDEPDTDMDATKPLLARRYGRRWSAPHPGQATTYYHALDDSTAVPFPATVPPLAVKTDIHPGHPSHEAPVSAGVERAHLLIGVAFGCISGSLSGMCLLFAKTGVELLILTVVGDNQFGRWQSWIIVLLLLVTALLQVCRITVLSLIDDWHEAKGTSTAMVS